MKYITLTAAILTLAIQSALSLRLAKEDSIELEDVFKREMPLNPTEAIERLSKRFSTGETLDKREFVPAPADLDLNNKEFSETYAWFVEFAGEMVKKDDSWKARLLPYFLLTVI